MVNTQKKDALLTIVAEWLEEGEIPALIPRDQRAIEPENLNRILAIVGPRRAGKTYFMYQLIQSLMQDGRYSKQDILFIDFGDYRLSAFTGDDTDELFAACHQLAGRYPRFLFFHEVPQPDSGSSPALLLSGWQTTLMARSLRIDYAGALYHCTSRGNARRRIYRDDADWEAFLTVLESVVNRFACLSRLDGRQEWLCHPYCLMDNH